MEENRLFKLGSFVEHNHTEQEDRFNKNVFENKVKLKCQEGYVDPSKAFVETMRT